MNFKHSVLDRIEHSFSFFTVFLTSISVSARPCLNVIRFELNMNQIAVISMLAG